MPKTMNVEVPNGKTQEEREAQRPYGQVAHAQGPRLQQASSGQSTPLSIIDHFKTHPGHALAVWLGIVAGVRLFFAITHDSFLGIDGGAYLLGMYQYWGDGAAQTGFDRPPLAPGYLLVPFVAVWGVTPLAYNLFAAIFSMALWPAFWLLARAILPFKWAALALILITLDWQQWIMFVTGVVPIVGFAGICVALWAMKGVATTQSPYINRHSLALIAVIPFIALTNQTSAGLALLTLPAAWLILPRKRELLVWLGVGGLLALAVAYPWYLAVAPGASETRYPGPLFYLTPTTQYQWQQAGFTLLALVFLSTMWKDTPLGIKMAAFVVAAHVPFLLIWSNDESIMNILFRGGIWIMVPFWLIVAWMLSAWKAQYKGVVIASLVVLGILGSGFVWQKQPIYSNYYSADMVKAVEQLDMSTVTRFGTNGSSRAWWLSALTGKDALWVMAIDSPPAWADRDRIAHCELGWIPDCATGYISHFVIDRTDRQSVPAPIPAAPDPDNPWASISEQAPWLHRIIQQGQVEVWASGLQAPIIEPVNPLLGAPLGVVVK